MPKPVTLRVTLCALLALLPLAGRAEVTYSSPSGFSVTHSLVTTASPAQTWAQMTGHIDQWWHGDHSWSADAGNFFFKPGVGGCFCEKLPPDGEVEHLRIIYFSPGKEVRFDGALGPLQTMAAQGRMVWRIDAMESGSTITFTYAVNGDVEGGLSGIAPAVDGVLLQQIERLVQSLESPAP
jgi:hypothetical protein